MNESYSSKGGVLHRMSYGDCQVFNEQRQEDVHLFRFRRIMSYAFVFCRGHCFIGPLICSIVASGLSSMRPSHFFVRYSFSARQRNVQVVANIQDEVGDEERVISLYLSRPFTKWANEDSHRVRCFYS